MNKKKQIGLKLLKIIIAVLPLIIIISIVAISDYCYLYKKNQLHEVTHYSISDTIDQIIGQAAPFIILSIMSINWLRNKEPIGSYAYKILLILMPMAIITFFWYFQYSNPFALAFLLLINLSIVTLGWSLERAIEFYKTNNNKLDR